MAGTEEGDFGGCGGGEEGADAGDGSLFCYCGVGFEGLEEVFKVFFNIVVCLRGRFTR